MTSCIRRSRLLLRRRFKHIRDRFQHGLCFREGLVVPHSEDLEPSLLEIPSSLLVVNALFLMLAAIKLYDQSRFDANEVSDLVPDRYLTPKAIASKLSTT